MYNLIPSSLIASASIFVISGFFTVFQLRIKISDETAVNVSMMLMIFALGVFFHGVEVASELRLDINHRLRLLSPLKRSWQWTLRLISHTAILSIWVVVAKYELAGFLVLCLFVHILFLIWDTIVFGSDVWRKPWKSKILSADIISFLVFIGIALVFMAVFKKQDFGVAGPVSTGLIMGGFLVIYVGSLVKHAMTNLGGVGKILFYKPEDKFGWLANFSEYPVRLDEYQWPTVEHFFQASKFDQPEIRQRIKNCGSPVVAKAIANEHQGEKRVDWKSVREDVMFQALYAKFTQNRQLADQLISTMSQPIVEQSPDDDYWGKLPDGSGENRVGVLLERIRFILIEQKREQAMTKTHTYRRDPAVRNYATVVFIVGIALLGAVMMTLTSSPMAKGAAFLWLPAALQLMAGVWLGPLRGGLAAGIGAYLAGILAYGGWGPPDIIMNLVAGGFANGFLPAVLFSFFNINPDFGGKYSDFRPALVRIVLLLIVCVVVAIVGLYSEMGVWGYLPAAIALIAAPFLFKSLRVGWKQFSLAVLICVVISFISAVIGSWGSVVAGQTWEAAFLATGLGWFFGDTVSCILGLYVLAQFTSRARERGVAPVFEE